MAFNMIAETHAGLLCADGEIPGDRGAGAVDRRRGGACDAVGLAKSPGGGCCRIACDAPDFARGCWDEGPRKEWDLSAGRPKLRKNLSAICTPRILKSKMRSR